MASRDLPLWMLLFFGSGAASLIYEVVWLRRLGLVLGGSAVASAVTLGAFMLGLALGGLLAGKLVRSSAGVGGALKAYALLELGAAAWAVIFPWVLDALTPLLLLGRGPSMLIAVAVLLVPATCLGATWPVLARFSGGEGATGLYAANTTGAVAGTLAATFILLPAAGVRSTELMAATLGVVVAAAAWMVSRGLQQAPEEPAPSRSGPVPWALLLAASAAGLAALGLEVVWMRLAAVALGASVQTIGLVLATFLAAVAVGAWLGRRWPIEPMRGLGWSLMAMGVLALVGATLWGQIPYGVAALYRWGGPEATLPGAALLAAIGMGGAPIASGVAFAKAVQALEDSLDSAAGWLYASNTLGAVAGSWLGGLVLLPLLGARGSVLLLAAVAGVAGAVVLRRPWGLLVLAVLAASLPAWDGKLFAVGVHLRISDFAEPSSAAVRAFADEGWDLLYYQHGVSGAVAVGKSTRTGNVWLSVNGKVDASTGEDMPTQQLSGWLPTQSSAHPEEVLVVGLASGVTAGAVLEHPEVQRLTLVELEPAVIEASHFFDHVNGRPLDDARTTLLLDDARAVLQRPGPTYDVIVSEPSNPWISGVSNLFTLEYWRLAQSRLADDGVFCQWVQLYGMGPQEFRALVRTFNEVFPNVWLFETIPGSDVLLIAAPSLPQGLPAAPTLGPEQVRALGGTGWLNTDDHPLVEFRAPAYLHYATGELNQRAIAEARSPASE